MKTKIMGTLAVSSLALVLVACGAQTSGAESAATNAAGTNAPSTTAAPAAAAEEASETESASASPTEEPMPQFGESYTWEDGITVKIGQPKAYKPSQSASVTGDGDAIAFNVTIVNGTGERFDPAMFNATMQSSNVEADQIFDSEKKLGGAPSTTILPKRESSFQVGFTVADKKDLVLEVAPSWDHESVIFTNF
ncbi:hypothetical protein FQ154_18200 [Paeniglutamicibacter gangotriensis]|uniref:DUF4352 domain-containing protein n=1 Tax=Paeniglutamicibacter gangotriensis TaxID=254787 RepID=A0A5B0E577_9MICC|nr:hypothetical protein [Paeniglutamicibacter gangotriensis]KAA0973452.1 hypothetical protein FQ154_18200 [Paeniglutamicibacter gangotriensis]